MLLCRDAPWHVSTIYNHIIMKRFHFLTTLLVLFPAFLFAGEGMWIPMLLQYNEKEMQEMGMKITAEDIYSINHSSLKDAIVLFGGLARAREFLEEPIRKAMDENVIPLWRGKVKLVFSQLKESDAAILGASALAWEL